MRNRLRALVLFNVVSGASETVPPPESLTSAKAVGFLPQIPEVRELFGGYAQAGGRC